VSDHGELNLANLTAFYLLYLTFVNKCDISWRVQSSKE